MAPSKVLIGALKMKRGAKALKNWDTIFTKCAYKFPLFVTHSVACPSLSPLQLPDCSDCLDCSDISPDRGQQEVQSLNTILALAVLDNIQTLLGLQKQETVCNTHHCEYVGQKKRSHL
jgi:hypothetical protein